MKGRNPFNKAPGQSLEDQTRQRQAALERRSKLGGALKAANASRSKAVQPAPAPEPPPRRQRDVGGYLDAITATQFHVIGDPAGASPSTAYLRLARAALEVMNDGAPQVLLAWPQGARCLSGLINLLTVGAICSSDPVPLTLMGQATTGRAAAAPLHAVIYPYARSSHAAGRRVQVGREQFGNCNFDHFKRLVDAGGNEGAHDYHQVLSRIRGLRGLAVDGHVYADFQHPVLDELTPHGPPKGDRPATGELLWRTRSKTDLGKQTRSGLADDPLNAPFYLFTVREADRLGVQLRAIRRAPDIFLLDLSRAAQARLGWNWAQRAKEAVEQLRAVHPATGILAVTDDPWSYRRARFDILGTSSKHRRGKTQPAAGHVALATHADMVVRGDSAVPSYQGGAQIGVQGFHGEADRSIEALRALAHRLIDIGDEEGAATARRVMATIRRSACLPGSVTDLARFLERETSSAYAADRMAWFAVAGDLAELTDARRVASQDAASAALADEVRNVMGRLGGATPMTLLLDDAIGPAVRASSRSLFVFGSDMLAEFAVERLDASHPKLKGRLEADMMRFGGRRSLAALADEPVTYRNQFKGATLVAPSRGELLAALASPWLPERVCVLADADTLAFAARDAAQLAAEIDASEVRRRLELFAQRANARVDGIGRHTILIDAEPPPEDDASPRDAVIDLSGGGRGDRRVLDIRMHNGQRVLARTGTGMVVRDAGAATTTFAERAASQLQPGDEVCVIGPAFVEQARTVVDIRATAAAEIRDYHQTVARRFAEFPGETHADRLRALVAAMGAPAIPKQRASYWVALAGETDKALHEVTPHAPQDRETFLRFTAALGMGQKLAESYWLWAVVAQRSHRLRAGNAFHDAFRGILTDPYAALAQNRDHAKDIRALRSLAEEHVATVAEIKRLDQA